MALLKYSIAFSNMKKEYIDKSPKMQITINLSSKVIDYFKEMADKKGIPYQTLINIF